MGNLRDKKGKFTSQKQLANGESSSCSFFTMDTPVNSDWAKIIVIAFVLNIINSKSVSKATFTQGGFIQVNVETDKKFIRICLLRLDEIRRSSNQKELDLDKN